MKTELPTEQVNMEQVRIAGESYFKISNSDTMRPFFMSIVSDSDHWMFIASNGGLSAGRKNAEYALFPYYTDDKITESAEITGSKTIIQLEKNGQHFNWEPFSERFDGQYKVTRNLYKSVYGNRVLFEEINEDLELSFQYEWCSSEQFGFVRQATLSNHGQGNANIKLIDGIQNILPYGVPSDLQNKTSNLVDAYKKCELEKDSGLGIYALSAIIVDKAEPSEALKANIAWSIGLENPQYLLSSSQLKNFRKKQAIQEELEVKGEKGAYLLSDQWTLKAAESKQWMIIADVNKNHVALVQLVEKIKSTPHLIQTIKEDIAAGTHKLVALTAAADGIQLTADSRRNARHFANTLFNIMRGGIFDDNYQIEKEDFNAYLAAANQTVFNQHKKDLAKLPMVFSRSILKTLADQQQDVHFKRLALEYMPLKFSRRHGDPSRPWNRFSINTRSEVDGSKILDYEGNWRDIFQNWEALALSYPAFLESMIYKFLNATTFDGYNPYRVTKGGFDWETIEPDDPWSYIGYWGDHQIIYLLKLLELQEKHQPGNLAKSFTEDCFVYANVPYKIKPYADLLKNPKDTIDFDQESDLLIRDYRAQIGADGALLKNANDSICQVNFMEKILATVLAKFSNFIPEGGIWMNTQRPEWNDANNALVGNGVSMVTLYYLRRFLNFFQKTLSKSSTTDLEVSSELASFFQAIVHTLDQNQDLLKGAIDGYKAKSIMDGLGEAASQYRLQIYEQSFSGKKESLSLSQIKNFVDLGLQYLEHSSKPNKNADTLFHAYNLLTVKSEKEISISYLSEMLEGQVAVLSSGYLSAGEALHVLDALKASKLFRPDQYSYLLYPNKDLPRFMQKNTVSAEVVAATSLLKKLAGEGQKAIIEQDIKGDFHFNGNFKNANDLKEALAEYAQKTPETITQADQEEVLAVFESIFNHKAFTGRSGTFFGYEGLGSIYWHMVSKLLLAVQECCLQAIESGASSEVIGRLLEHYYEINEGIGVNKPPSLYGAFPTDPYSHTPAGKGAQQPGMTGQVKEDILSRFGELGVSVKGGQLSFNPNLLRKSEFLDAPVNLSFIDLEGHIKQIELDANSLAFTYCQVPVVFKIASNNELEVSFQNGEKQLFSTWDLDQKLSATLFNRSGKIKQIQVKVEANYLK